MPAEASSERPRRRFTIADGMVLVIATAVGIALMRAYDAVHQFRPQVAGTEVILYGSQWLFIGWSLAVVLLEVRPSWLHLRRLACRPGWLACLMVVFVVLLRLAKDGLLKILSLALQAPPWTVYGTFGWSFERLTRDLPEQSMQAVAVAWLALAITGRWRPERAWTDRLGRIIAVWWFLAALARPVLSAYRLL